MYLPKSLRSSKTDMDSFLLHFHDLRHNSVLCLFSGKEERRRERKEKKEMDSAASTVDIRLCMILVSWYLIYLCVLSSPTPWDPPVCSTLELSSPIPTQLYVPLHLTLSLQEGCQTAWFSTMCSTVGCKSLIPDPKEGKERGRHHKEMIVSHS